MGRNIVNLADFKLGKPAAQDLMAACVAAGQAELLLKDLSGPVAAQYTTAATHSPATKLVGLQQHVKTPDVSGTLAASVVAATATAAKKDAVATRKTWHELAKHRQACSRKQGCTFRDIPIIS